MPSGTEAGVGMKGVLPYSPATREGPPDNGCPRLVLNFIYGIWLGWLTRTFYWTYYALKVILRLQNRVIVPILSKRNEESNVSPAIAFGV